MPTMPQVNTVSPMTRSQRSYIISGMGMHRRRVQALHVIKRDGRVDQKAEQAGTHEIPERNGDKEINRPLVGRDP